MATRGAALSAAWAWPVPLAQPEKLQRYEAGLKELLARQGLDGRAQLDSLSLAEVVVDVTTLISLEFEVEREREPQNVTLGACWPLTTIMNPFMLGRLFTRPTITQQSNPEEQCCGRAFIGAAQRDAWCVGLSSRHHEPSMLVDP